jgi:hypothetical protein
MGHMLSYFPHVRILPSDGNVGLEGVLMNLWYFTVVGHSYLALMLGVQIQLSSLIQPRWCE